MDKLLSKTEQGLHKAFLITVMTNGAIGVLDLCVGIFFVCIPYIVAVVPFESMGYLGRFLMHFLPTIRGIGVFYFLSHGAVKLLLAWGLLKEKLWAYPVAIVFFTMFCLSQIGTLIRHFSWFVLILLVLNASVLAMVLHEYGHVKKAFLPGALQ